MKKFKVYLGAGAYDIVRAENRHNAQKVWEKKNPLFTIPSRQVSEIKPKKVKNLFRGL